MYSDRYVDKMAKYWDTSQLDRGVVPLIVGDVSSGAVDTQGMHKYYVTGRVRPVGIQDVGCS